MTTTRIGPDKGRHPDPGGGDDVAATLDSARRIFRDVSGFLEDEIERLKGEGAAAPDPERMKAVADLIKQNQQALLKVLDMRAKLGRDICAECTQMLDLEAARAEIDSRLARFAE